MPSASKTEQPIVFFDVGGTLLDAPDLFAAILERIPDASRRGINRETVAQYFISMYCSGADRCEGDTFMTVEAIIARTLEKKGGISPEDAGRISTELYEDTFLRKSVMLPGAQETLARLKENGARLVIASDADADLLMRELAVFGIRDYFSEFCVSSEIGAYKPTPAFIEACRKAVDRLNTNRFQGSPLYFVGDSACDMETASLLGAKGILIDIGRHSTDVKADYRINSLEETIPVIFPEQP